MDSQDTVHTGGTSLVGWARDNQERGKSSGIQPSVYPAWLMRAITLDHCVARLRRAAGEELVGTAVTGKEPVGTAATGEEPVGTAAAGEGPVGTAARDSELTRSLGHRAVAAVGSAAGCSGGRGIVDDPLERTGRRGIVILGDPVQGSGDTED